MFATTKAIAANLQRRISISSSSAISRGRSFRRPLSAATDPEKYYYVEANNAARKDATQLTVEGPDRPGIMASMTVALATSGASLLELHAAKASKSVSEHYHDASKNTIKDIFHVVSVENGEQFPDASLGPLAEAVLHATAKPLRVLGARDDDTPLPPIYSVEEQITIVPSTAARDA